MQQWFIYILVCSDDSYYVGQTNDVAKRLQEHMTKKFCGYTSSRLPLRLVSAIQCSSRSQALSLEKKIKKWSREKKRAFVEGKFSLKLN